MKWWAKRKQKGGAGVTLYTIKPLAWAETRTGAILYHEASTVFGVIQVWERKHMANPTPDKRWYWSCDSEAEDPTDCGFAETIDAAKAAAEAWYLAKMAEDLEEVTT